MGITYDAPSTDWETATEITAAPRIIYPIAQNDSAIIYERDYVQNEADWSPLAMDTADGTFVDAFLVEETITNQIGGSLIEWTRRFATVPDNWTEYDQRMFQFPGYYNDPDTGGFRAPMNKNATVEVRNSYYLTTDPYTDFDVSSYVFESKDGKGVVLSYVGPSTSPSISTYQGLVTGEDLINIAHSTLERYAGNIWVQKIPKTKAQ